VILATRAGAAVSDSRLDIAGRDDRGCGADHAEVVGPGAGWTHRWSPARDPCSGCSRRRSCGCGGRIDCILDTTERRNYFVPRCRTAFGFVTSPYFAKGSAMMREVKAKVAGRQRRQ